MRRFAQAIFLNSLALALLFSRSPVVLAQTSASFRRGDANADSRVDLSDSIFTLRFLFVGGTRPPCLDAADSNDDGYLDISDAVHTLIHLFAGGAELPAPGLACGTDPTQDSLGCGSYQPCAAHQGQSEFATPLAGAPGAGGPGREDQAGGPAPPAGPPAPPAPAAQGRTIEESDIYKLSGTNLFVLNRYRGLQILDLADLDHPHLLGRAPIFGYPREMYVRGSTAYVIVSDYYTFWRDASAGDLVPRSFYGSQLRILDVSDVRNPRVVGGINLEGDCSDSRIVGDVMYLVSNRYPWYSGLGTTDTEDKTQVLSVQVGDPADVKLIDTKDFPRNGWEHHISVTAETIYLASSGYVNDRFTGFETKIRYVDISDPAGLIRLRGEATVLGRVQDRWSMDESNGVLRVASSQSWGNGDVYLTTFSIQNPDAISKLGGYTLQVHESLTAARFDGDRGYLVSYRNIDPLFTFDLSNPSRPALLGELKMTGWLDFIVPMGDRLVALGHEDLTNPTGGRTISLAVSLIDVSKQAATVPPQPTTPELLSRVSLDGVWGWIPSGRDDFAKVFKVLAEQGLILFPFQAWSQTDYRTISGVQLIDFDSSKLTLRGLIENGGWVERGISYDPSTVLTLSSEIFQVLDITNRDKPRLRGRLELARNVQDFALLPGDYAVQLSGDWYLGDTKLVVTPLDDPDTPQPVSELRVPAPYGRMFANGSLVYLSSVQDVSGNGGVATRATVIQVVDLSDPSSPRLRGSVALPEKVWPGYGFWYWGWGDEVVQVNGSTLAFHRYPFRWFDCLACPAGARAIDGGQSPDDTIYLVDLKDPDSPKLASTVTLAKVDWAWGLRVSPPRSPQGDGASGTTLYLSIYRAFLADNLWMARYYLRRIEVADPANPVELPEVNIPGMFVDASPVGSSIYTLETYWDQSAQKSRSIFHVLAIDGEKAYLQSSVELEGYVSGIQVKEGAAFATTQWWETRVLEGGGSLWLTHADLLAIDLSDPGAIRVSGKATIPFDYVYLQKVEGGRAFLGSGAGIFTYLVSDITSLGFEEFFRTQGWSQDIVVRGNLAFVPSGYYGVQVLHLGSSPGG